MPIGSDFFDRNHLTGARPAGGVTRRTRRRKDRVALLCEAPIDRERELRRRQVVEPGAETIDRVHLERRHGRAIAEP